MNHGKAKILMIYPTLYQITGLPIGIASIGGVLNQHGYEMKIFDTAFYNYGSDINENTLRANRAMSKEIKDKDRNSYIHQSDMEQDLFDLIYDFKPQIIGVQILESTYERSVRLLKFIKYHFKDIIIIAGGVFTTMVPETVVTEETIDIICLGEGENPMLELCQRVSEDKPYHDIAGLWVKQNGTIIKNKPAVLYDVNELPYMDFTGFDERLFFRPMQGKIYKMVNIETIRGCPYRCTYCAAPQLKNFFRTNGSGKYYREKKIAKILDEIKYQVKTHSADFIYFSSETFLAMKEEEFQEFIEGYQKIKVPFWFQTRFETITEERIKALKGIGMHWLTLGVEHGNEQFRREVLKRLCSNGEIINGVKILKKLDVGATVNNILGLPFETKELIEETFQLNRKLWQINNKLECNLFMFIPFKGCELYDICISENLIDDRPYTDTTMLTDDTVLNFPEEYKKELKSFIKTFNLYVKLPEDYDNDIRIAQQDDDEGNAMFDKLFKIVKSEEEKIMDTTAFSM